MWGKASVSPVCDPINYTALERKVLLKTSMFVLFFSPVAKRIHCCSHLLYIQPVFQQC